MGSDRQEPRRTGCRHAADSAFSVTRSSRHARCPAARHRDARPARKDFLAQFKPALAMNDDILARYGANRLRVGSQFEVNRAFSRTIYTVLNNRGVLALNHEQRLLN